jgi:hypothetical protein
MRLLWLFVLFGVFYYAACKKETKPPTIRLIPEEMKAYWDFKPGTYWIYQDSVTGAIDSVYVTEYYNDTAQGILNYTQEPMTYEFLKYIAHSSLDGHDYGYWINTQAGLKNYPEFNSVFSGKSGVDAHTSFVYPLIVGNYLTQGYSGGVDTCVIHQLFVSFDGYSDVVQIDNTLNSFEGYANTKAYYAKHIGLIRYEVPDSNKYRILIDYHIEP